MIAFIVSIVIGSISWLLTEKLFPGRPTTPLKTEKKEEFAFRIRQWERSKHFWSIVLLFVASGLAFEIQLGIEARQTTRSVEKIDQKLEETNLRLKSLTHVYLDAVDKDVVGFAEAIVTEYHANFHDTKHPIKNWARTSIEDFKDEIRVGNISMPFSQAIPHMGRMFEHAKKWIVAVNIGSTRSFFTNTIYKTQNQKAKDNGTPVVRFFLYSPNEKILLTDSCFLLNGKVFSDNGVEDQSARAWARFKAEVKTIHEDLGTTMSIPIDIGTMKASPDKLWDVLLVDNEFAAFVSAGTRWGTPIRVSASRNRKRLGDIRRDLMELFAHSSQDAIFEEGDKEKIEAIAKDIREAF